MSAGPGERMAPEGAPSVRYAVGVDLGGTNLRMALYPVSGPRLESPTPTPTTPAAPPTPPTPPRPVLRHRQLVGESRSPAELADTLVGLLETQVAPWLRERGLDPTTTPLGIGIAAMLGPGGIVVNAPNLHWRDVPFVDLLRARLGPQQPLGLYNDVAAITHGEWSVGAGVGVRDLLAVFVGTGVGGAVIADGRSIDGASMCAGEIGHIKVAHGDAAPLCGCGMRGCVEAFVGGTHLQARIRQELAHGAHSAALARADGDVEQLHPGHLDAAAADGDAYALGLYTELAPLLAIAIGNAITLLNPARLVLGGGMLSRMPVFRAHVLAALPGAVNPAQLAPLSIVEPALGDDAGMLGSALLVS